MELIRISHLSKSYKISGKSVEVLKDIDLTLPESGMVVILGKSGSGKSTLLNIIGGIDRPTKGTVINTKDKKSKKNTLSLKNTSFIFQHYHLLENETPLYNVMLPGLIRGMDKTILESQARKLFSHFQLDENIINKETRLLSGGEKERIAILRALITDPRLILADEPTGALDAQNAEKTMDILKKASSKRLVLLVTHNTSLAFKYADRIITLADGKVIKDETIKENKEEIFRSKVEFKCKNNWSVTIVNHNFRKRLKRNLVSIIGMTISLIFCYLLFGFTFQSNKAIEEVSTKHFDYGTCIVREEQIDPTSSSISLVRTLRPSEDESNYIKERFPEFEIVPNYDSIFNSAEIYVGNKLNNEINSSYVLSFQKSCFDKSLLIEGDILKANSWKDIVVNRQAYKLIKDQQLHYKVVYKNSLQLENKEIVDYFEYEEKLNVIAVVDEFDFLAVPKLYFSYEKVDELLDSTFLDNYSDYKNVSFTWKDLVIDALPGDELSSYSMRCMLKNIKDKSKIEDLLKENIENIKIENDSLTIKEAIISLTTAATYGLDIFLVIALAGSVLIVGVFSYSAYVDDKKESSILTCLGAKNSDIVGIFAAESMIVTFLSFLLATVSSYFIETPINYLLNHLIDVPNLIKIPFGSMKGVKGFLPLCIFIGSMIVTIIFSSVPILINKNVSIKKELSDL